MVPRPLRPPVLTALAVALCLAATAAARAKVFEPETFTLENGLQVVVISNHRAPIVNHMVSSSIVLRIVGSARSAPAESSSARSPRLRGSPGTAS